MFDDTATAQNGIDEYATAGDEPETCEHGDLEWCAARDDGALPCFACYLAENQTAEVDA